MSTYRRGNARVYLTGHPDGEPYHPGYRGNIAVDDLGVHVRPDCEMLATTEWESVGGYFDGTITLPWHRIDSIEWTRTDPPARKEP